MYIYVLYILETKFVKFEVIFFMIKTILTFSVALMLMPAASAREFSVLTWNLLLLPNLVKTTLHDQRLPLITERLKSSSYDFIFLQEVFTSSGYNSIAKALKAKGYFDTGSPNRDFFKPVNSGVVIFSKYPLSQIESTPLKGSIASDFFSSKAIVSAVAKISEDLSIQLINTHLQSKETPKSVVTRKLQLFQLEEGFKKTSSKLKTPMIFAGDLNIDRNLKTESTYMHNMLLNYKFNTSLPSTQIKNTVSCPTNALKRFIDKNCKYTKYLDYIYASSPLKLEQLSVIESRENYIMDGVKRNLPLSDHYAVEAVIKL